MRTQEYEDAMLLRKTVALREGIRARNLNPLWVEHMLQQVVENNHGADLVLRETFTTLKKPKLSDIAALLERPKPQERQRGFEPRVLPLLETMNWSEGPDEVDLTLATMKNLFLDRSEGPGETERVVRTTAHRLGLQDCPDWVIPALILDYEHMGAANVSYESLNRPEINACLTHDEERDIHLGFWLGTDWHVYKRCSTLDPDVSWSSPVHWLFVKPRLELA